MLILAKLNEVPIHFRFFLSFVTVWKKTILLFWLRFYTKEKYSIYIPLDKQTSYGNKVIQFQQKLYQFSST